MKEKTITLREARQAAGLTMTQLSEKSGVGWSLLQAIEGGRTPGSIVARHRLSDALGIPFHVLWRDSLVEMEELFDMMKRQRQEGSEFKDAAALKKLSREQVKKLTKERATERKLERKIEREAARGKKSGDATASKTK